MSDKKPIAYYPTPDEIVDYMIKMVSKKNPNILESGFGTGAFLSKLNTISDNVIGVEYSDAFFQVAVAEYPEYTLYQNDYLEFTTDKKIDVIIGNPPYIAAEKMPVEMSDKLKEMAGTKEANIYYGFIIKSIELLEEGGELIYILPYDFFYNSYAKQLRQYMLDNGYFTDIIDFGEIKLFKDAAPETIIFKYIKSTKKIKPDINVINFTKRIDYDKTVIALSNVDKSEFINQFNMPNFDTTLIWSLTNVDKLKKYKLLKSLSEISVGIVSGCDGVFKIDTNFISTLPKDSKDSELCVKFLKNSNLSDLTSTGYVDYIYIPKNIKTEEDLKEYPLIYKYLNDNKEILSDRYMSGKAQWFNYLAIRNEKRIFDFFGKYKLLVPGKTRKENQWFSISNEEAYIAGDLIMISSDDEVTTWFLWGYLNSSFFSEYYSSHGAKKGNRTVFTQKLLSELHIPDFDKSVIKKIAKVSKDIFDKKEIFETLDKYIVKVINDIQS
jgi:adenine-specific DNA-methyltransferase